MQSLTRVKLLALASFAFLLTGIAGCDPGPITFRSSGNPASATSPALEAGR